MSNPPEQNNAAAAPAWMTATEWMETASKRTPAWMTAAARELTPNGTEGTITAALAVQANILIIAKHAPADQPRANDASVQGLVDALERCRTLLMDHLSYHIQQEHAQELWLIDAVLARHRPAPTASTQGDKV